MTIFNELRGKLGILIGLSLVVAVLTVVPLVAMLWLAGDPSRRNAAVIILLAAVILRHFLHGATGLYSHRVDNDFQLSIRRKLVRHLRNVPLGWIEHRQSQGIVALVQRSVSSVHHLIGHALHDTVQALVVPLLSLGFLFAMSPRMAGIALVPILGVGITMSIMLSVGKQRQQRHDDTLTEFTGAVVERAHGAASFALYDEDEAAAGRLKRAGGEYIDAWNSWSKQSSWYLGLIDLFVAPITIMLLMVSAADLESGLVQLAAGLVLGLGIAAPLLNFAASSQALSSGLAAAKEIEEVLAVEPLPVPEAPATLPQDASGRVEFKQVTFSYPTAADDEPAIADFSLVLEPGTTTALVGASGSGKTTLVRLLARFHDVDKGGVFIDGVDVRELGMRDVYQNLAIVFQEPQLLSVSIRDNLRLGARGEPSDEQLFEAAEKACIADYIRGLEHGLDSVIGVDANPSGGQAQRLSIARAFLQQPRVIILDEATAFTDPESQAELQQALSNFAQGRTCIVIAHRLRTIAGADQIAVLEAGRLAEIGTHDDLLHAGGIYTDLWEKLA